MTSFRFRLSIRKIRKLFYALFDKFDLRFYYFTKIVFNFFVFSRPQERTIVVSHNQYRQSWWGLRKIGYLWLRIRCSIGKSCVWNRTRTVETWHTSSSLQIMILSCRECVFSSKSLVRVMRFVFGCCELQFTRFCRAIISNRRVYVGSYAVWVGTVLFRRYYGMEYCALAKVRL